ncbi:class I SAM-dependent methyltransferase [Streptomyces specialis]|uniref:class I SAM-dependent methyltransferase n=1 Tax=Streptomyces specialis TaxID=498367 RepID=UPI00073F89A8|nr:class I SAM-dependent methyltransferase [Streptomyces specialis]
MNDTPRDTPPPAVSPPGERRRLESIQAGTDAFTTGIIDGLGLPDDAACLELGAGAGSVARWLAAHRPRGRVTAVDIDVRHLDPGGPHRLDVVRADITDESFAPGRFDLVHARFVLCHLPSRDALVARAARWLRPGGWLVVTDPYQLPADTSPFPVVRRLMEAYRQGCARAGTDLTWARSLPALLAGAGLSPVEFAGRPACMGNGDKDRWRVLVEQAAPALLTVPGFTPADLDAFRAHLADPAFVDIPQITLAAWARRPPAA